MTLKLSDEERGLLALSLQRLLDAGWPVEHAVELSNNSESLRQLWTSLREVGLAELFGAEGPGLHEALMAFEALGRASCPGPLIGACIANKLLGDSNNADAQLFLASMRDGDSIPAVVLAGFDGDYSAGEVSFVNGRLCGGAAFVEGALVATHLVVFVSQPLGVAVVRVDDPGACITQTPGLAVPPLSQVVFDCEVAAWQPRAKLQLTDAASIVRLAGTARALGSAQRAFDLALEHAKTRRQFGHVIGEFQAIQHKLADCLTRLDGARLTLMGAADAYDGGNDSWRVFADAAIAFSGPGLRQVLLEVHHTLGAIGYAEEHETPRHFRSVHADLVRFGGAARARAALADYLLAPVL